MNTFKYGSCGGVVACSIRVVGCTTGKPPAAVVGVERPAAAGGAAADVTPKLMTEACPTPKPGAVAVAFPQAAFELDNGGGATEGEGPADVTPKLGTEEPCATPKPGVEPMLHKHVTMFFSDIVGFTNICDKMYPWEVIAMLNRLYCVMDFLAKKFDLFKVETIGDAYVCCSGLPYPDANHEEKVANFAIAVNHFCRRVLSPLDEKPIQLRIGIHTGACASGIVGRTNPRYCVFGDMVNTTSRHESSGAPGRIHCSSRAFNSLTERSGEHFYLRPRGLVEMKGKGDMLTFWLEGAKPNNTLVNKKALELLDAEVVKLLKTTFDGPKSERTTDNQRLFYQLDKALSRRSSRREMLFTRASSDTSVLRRSKKGMPKKPNKPVS